MSLYKNFDKKNVSIINDDKTLNKSEETNTNIIKNIEYFSQDEKIIHIKLTQNMEKLTQINPT